MKRTKHTKIPIPNTSHPPSKPPSPSAFSKHPRPNPRTNKPSPLRRIPTHTYTHTHFINFIYPQISPRKISPKKPILDSQTGSGPSLSHLDAVCLLENVQGYLPAGNNGLLYADSRKEGRRLKDRLTRASIKLGRIGVSRGRRYTPLSLSLVLGKQRFTTGITFRLARTTPGSVSCLQR